MLKKNGFCYFYAKNLFFKSNPANHLLKNEER